MSGSSKLEHQITPEGGKENGADVFGCSDGQISWCQPAQYRRHLRWQKIRQQQARASDQTGLDSQIFGGSTRQLLQLVPSVEYVL